MAKRSWMVLRTKRRLKRQAKAPWCERKRIGYVFGLAGNSVLLRRVGDLAEDAALGRVDGEAEKVRRYGELRYAAGTIWSAPSLPLPSTPSPHASAQTILPCRL